MASLPLPRPFGGYTLLRELDGPPGELFLAQGADGEICQIRRGLASAEGAQAMLGLRHDNLVGVTAVGEARGDPFLVLEHVAGHDLRAIWNRCAELRRRIPVDFAIYVAREVCRGLAYIHEVLGLGLMHREIAPANILVGFDGAVKVAEFGPSRSTRAREITGPGMLMGRASYLSPEEARGEVVDHRADLYAAGVVLWEMLTGRQLLAASHRSPASALASARNPNIRPPSELAPGLPEGLDSAVLAALAQDPAQRYPAADRFRARLSEILGRSFPGYDAGRAGAFVRDIFPREVELAADFASPAAQGGLDGRGGIVSTSDTNVNGESLTPREIAERRRGTVIAQRFRVEDLLSFDGMGALYRVRNLDQGKSCALRVLPGSYTSDPELTTRFLREAQAANNLGHPNIIKVHDLGKLDDGSLYSAMELLQGETIAAVLREEGRLSQARAVHIATQVCRALAAAHEAGIIHRDLKPESIVLTAHEGDLDFVKLVDFGICKQVDSGGTASQPGMIIGTPDYMAPEQAAGAEANAASDIYALGCVLFEMLTGQRPYQGRSSLDVLMQKRSKDAPRLANLAPELGMALSDVVARCLARRPEDRPESMRELEYELMTAAEQSVRPRGESSLTDLPPPPEAGTMRPTQRPTPVPMPVATPPATAPATAAATPPTNAPGRATSPRPSPTRCRSTPRPLARARPLASASLSPRPPPIVRAARSSRSRWSAPSRSPWSSSSGRASSGIAAKDRPRRPGSRRPPPRSSVIRRPSTPASRRPRLPPRRRP
ncbi:MAG: protein kinase [Nannocystaceae bacterium]